MNPSESHQIHVDVVEMMLKDLECLKRSSDVQLDFGGLTSNPGLSAEAHLLVEAVLNTLASHELPNATHRGVGYTVDQTKNLASPTNGYWAGPWSRPTISADLHEGVDYATMAASKREDPNDMYRTAITILKHGDVIFSR